jgi:hypothetical protein
LATDPAAPPLARTVPLPKRVVASICGMARV